MDSSNRIYSGQNISGLNYNQKYGYGWISNANIVSPSQNYKLYATGNCELSRGRIYVALPADKNLSQDDIRKYNIIK